MFKEAIKEIYRRQARAGHRWSHMKLFLAVMPFLLGEEDQEFAEQGYASANLRAVVEVLTAHKSDLVRGAKVVGTRISISVTIMVEVRGQDAVLVRAGQTTTETTVVEDLVKDGMIKEATVTGATIIRTRSVAPGHHVHVMTGAHASGPTPEIGIRVMIKGVTVRKKSAVTVGTVSGVGTEFRPPEKVS